MVHIYHIFVGMMSREMVAKMVVTKAVFAKMVMIKPGAQRYLL